MDIMFEPFVYDPANSGVGSGSIRTLRTQGFDVSDFGVAAIRPLRTRTTTRGFYKQGTDGTGIAQLKTPQSFGLETGNTYGVATIRNKLRTWGAEVALDVLQNGTGVASLRNVTTSATAWAKTEYAFTETLRGLNAYGDETAVDYGIARLRGLTTSSYLPDISGDLYFTIVQSPGYVSAYAEAGDFAETADAFTGATALDADMVYGIAERALFNAALFPQARVHGDVYETLSARDKLARLLEAVQTDTMSVSGDIIGDVVKLVALVDAMRLADSTLTQHMAVGLVAELFTAAGVALSVFDGDITAASTVTAALEGRYVAMAHLLDAMLTQADALGLAIVTIHLQDDMSVEGSVLTQALFYGLLEEHLDFTVNLALDGLPYLGVCMNATNKAVTEYQPYDFNSLAVLQGVLYGANDAGLFRLDGDTDDAVSIDAYARTALTRIADGRMSQVDSAYLGYSSDGVIQLKAITTDATGAKTSRVYQLNAQIADANRSGRIKLGRGVKSVYWAFEVSNSLGADFTIDVLELRVLALSRRI